ncbi:hypothetical protein [Paenibacillus senegalensis]|uniref:hypothetical protein n=1 Tax=Paenibacillus senegalensis TaxID=1465766 RepID=UPI000288716D|nr:hypothetical protein [Paenibacillus senegalensis]
MNIAFDMSFTKGVSLTRGIGRYNKQLIESLSQLSDAHSFFISTLIQVRMPFL